ncbi:hypothetical protein D3C80_2041010 [compost metagenome]
MKQKAAAFITGITIKRGKFGHGECGSVAFYDFNEPLPMKLATTIVYIRERINQVAYDRLIGGVYEPTA